MRSNRSSVAAAAVLTGGFAFLYAPVIVKLVHDWATDDNASHGFLVVPLALYFAWERRQQLLEIEPRPAAGAMAIIFVSLGLLVAGTLGAELFLARVSIIGVVAGTIAFIYGWGHLRLVAFPVAFLVLMVPPPALVFNQVAFPLQLLASHVGELVLQSLRVPVLREGNVIILAHTTLEVAEACSGIRSLISLITLGIVYGYFSDRRMWVRLAIAASTVPVAVVANALRVAGTGVAAQYYGPEVADGFLHTFSGWLVFVAALGAVVAVRQLIAAGIRIADGAPAVVGS
jgi:exosortase